MDEREKMLQGKWYDATNQELIKQRLQAKDLCFELNQIRPSNLEKRNDIINKLLGYQPDNLELLSPFICDYGRNVYIGNNVSINMNCTFVDCNEIRIGDCVMIASNIQIYTATHPVELKERLTEDWTRGCGKHFCQTYALPVTIGSGCWLGGGVIVLPGVTIGEGCVIGAGSVVTKDIPANSVAVGNPCRVIRKINGDEQDV